MKGPRLALIGCGAWGRNILRDLIALDCPVVVVDPAPEARERATQQGATVVQAELDPRAAKDLDGVIVATPASDHAARLDRWLETPLPIYVEKPFTTDPAKARDLADRGAGRLFVMHQWRYHPAVEALRDLARSQELGPVDRLRSLRVNWTSPRKDVDGIWTLAPHDLSIALEIFGALPEPRFALAERAANGPAGLLAVLGTTPALTLEVSTRFPEKHRELRLQCRDGVAIFDASRPDQLKIVRNEARIEDGTPETRLHPLSDERPLQRELRAFLEHIRGGPPPRSSAQDAARVVEALSALRRLAGIETIA